MQRTAGAVLGGKAEETEGGEVRATIIPHGGRWFLRNQRKICAGLVCHTRIHVKASGMRRGKNCKSANEGRFTDRVYANNNAAHGPA